MNTIGTGDMVVNRFLLLFLCRTICASYHNLSNGI
jgi:hypothetical protein